MGNSHHVIEDYEVLWQRWQGSESFRDTVREHRRSRRRFHALLGRLICRTDPGARIVELGCGTAVDIGILSTQHPAQTFMATDLSRNATRLAFQLKKECGMRFHVFAANIRHLPFERESVDVVFSQGVMEHFEDPLPYFEEQIAVLRPGGVLVVSVPQRFSGYTLYKHRQMRKGRWTLGWETEFSYSRLTRILRGYGLIEKKRMGEGYWRSWREPAFVLRDAVDKIYRYAPFRFPAALLWPRSVYRRLWRFLEERWGHLFMQNLIVAFRKLDGTGE
jgi:SAM-dependent methyltransferase